MILSYVLTILTAYLLGSINTSIIVSKIFTKTDIRKSGSGNAGATNTLRVLGKKMALLVVLGDALKGIISVIIARWLSSLFKLDTNILEYIASVFVVIGHVFPVYFGFKGGKGIMTAISVVFMLDYVIGLILLGSFILLVLIFNYISLASIVCSAIYPLLVFLLHKGNTFFLLSGVVLAFITITKHHTNIKRLINGNESKFIKSR